jgi:hypothetical protein
VSQLATLGGARALIERADGTERAGRAEPSRDARSIGSCDVRANVSRDVRAIETQSSRASVACGAHRTAPRESLR